MQSTNVYLHPTQTTSEALRRRAVWWAEHAINGRWLTVNGKCQLFVPARKQGAAA